MRNRGEPVARRWPGETFVCIASGPSLTAADVEAVRGRARVVVVNNGLLLAPWADVLWATDARWWKWHAARVATFGGLKFSLSFGGPKLPSDVHVLRNAGYSGWSTDPSAVYHGKNGGFAALQLAALLGAARVLLLGYDMQRTGNRDHWHGDHPYKMPNPYRSWVRAFTDNAPAMRAAGLKVVNCSRETALECFPRLSLTEALGATAEAVA